MKLAAIDVGSNTVLLAIAERYGCGLRKFTDVSTIVRLGEGLKKTGYLSSQAMKRTVDVLSHYVEICSEYGVEDIVVVATAAVREARNSQDFLDMAKTATGLTVRILSGEEEAYYTYLSVKLETGTEGDFMVVDVGGGSTEIIEGNEHGMNAYISLPVGSVNLTEMYIHHDPPYPEELRELKRYVNTFLQLPFEGRERLLVGTAGTVTNCAAIILGIEKFDSTIIEGVVLTCDEIDDLIACMSLMTVEERKQITGIEEKRADVLLQGIVLLRAIMERLDVNSIKVNTGGVRYGVLYEALSER